MNIKRFINPIAILFVLVVLSVMISGIPNAQSEEYIKKPSDSYHQSFAPYEYPTEFSSPKPKAATVKVTEIMTYEVAVDEKKLNTNALTMEDLELTEVVDKDKINFHQVDCYFYAKVKQTQERKTDFLSSTRWREGQQYWLSDGGKYVEWEPWSIWYDNKSKW